MKTILSIVLILSIIFIKNANSQNFNYDIKYHRLEFKVDPAIKYIEGKITTYFEPLSQNFNQISFDLIDELNVDSIKYHNTTLDYSHNRDVLTINFTEKISVAILDSISVYYHGVPTHSGFGSFITSSHWGHPIMWTLSEPYGAKTWWPCKQALNDKADSIDLIVTTQKEYKVAGNGLIVNETIIGDSLKTTHWKHKYPITAYLIAFAVTNYAEYYDYVPINDSVTIPILEYVYPEDSSYIRLKSPDIIDVFQYYCDSFLMYPFVNEKYGQAQFNWGGGMEHQTMTFLSSFGHSLMAHELAHQWFGNYITCGSWHDIWLNEGFAVYLEGLTCEQGLSNKSWDDWKATTMSKATEYPEGSVFVEDTSSVSRIFNHNLTYMKGGMILHLLRGQIGDKAFFDGIRNYLRDPKLAYSYARVDNLKQHFENTSNCDLTYFFEDWYYGEGYPEYSIYWWQTNDNQLHININQTHSAGDTNFFELNLPIKIIIGNKDTTIILKNTKQNQTFSIQQDNKIRHLSFDPERWIITKNVSITQIIRNINNLEVTLSPNPANDKLKIDFPIETTIIDYSIYDTLGRKFVRKQLNKRTSYINININQLNSGQYIIYFKTLDGIVSKNFIKN